MRAVIYTRRDRSLRMKNAATPMRMAAITAITIPTMAPVLVVCASFLEEPPAGVGPDVEEEVGITFGVCVEDVGLYVGVDVCVGVDVLVGVSVLVDVDVIVCVFVEVDVASSHANGDSTEMTNVHASTLITFAV